MKQLLLLIVIALATLSGKAQPFRITTDTIRLDSTMYRYIGMMTDYHDKYFCVVSPTDEDDEESGNKELPEDNYEGESLDSYNFEDLDDEAHHRVVDIKQPFHGRSLLPASPCIRSDR